MSARLLIITQNTFRDVKSASALFMKFVGLPSTDYDIRYLTDIRTFIFIYFTIDRNGLSRLRLSWRNVETIMKRYHSIQFNPTLTIPDLRYIRSSKITVSKRVNHAATRH